MEDQEFDPGSLNPELMFLTSMPVKKEMHGLVVC